MAEVERIKKEKPPGKSGGTEDGLVRMWRRRLELSEKKLEEQGGDPNWKKGEWKELVKFFEGSQWPDGTGKRGRFHRITANQLKSNVDSIRPQLYFRNPKVNISIETPYLAPGDIYENQIDPNTGQEAVDPNGNPVPVLQPTGPVDMNTGQPAMAPVVKFPKGTAVAFVGGKMVDAERQTNLLESIDNAILKQVKADSKIRRVINDALVLPYGVLKWTWHVDTRMMPRPDGTEGEEIVDASPRLQRVKPWCFLWDCDLDEFDLDQANWVAEVKFLSKEEIKEDPALDVDFSQLKEPDYYVDAEYDVTESSSEKNQDMARYKVYEIHDLKHKCLYVWIEGSDKMNRKEDPSPYGDVEGSVYSILGFDETIDDSFPIPKTRQIRSLSEGYNYMLSFAVNHAQRGNRKYIAQEGWNAKPEDKVLWAEGADLTTIEVKDKAMAPQPVQDAPVPQDVYAVKDVLKNEITEAIAVTANARGTRQPGVDTATEASYIQGGADVKTEEMRDVVRKFMNLLIKKLNQILKKYATQESVQEVVGKDRAKEWLTWSAKDIRGEFLEEVDIYSSMPFSELEEKKQAMEMFSLLGADPYVNPFELRKKVFDVMKWDGEEILYSEEEFSQMQQAQQQQAQATQQAQEGEKQAARTIRPTEGNVQRKSDMRAGIIGGARR